MIRKSVILFLLFISAVTNYSQDSLLLHFVPTWNGTPVKLNTSYTTSNKATIEVAQLKFYLSNVSTANTEKTPNYHLLNLTDIASFSFKIPAHKSSQLSFNLGIDSLTNMQGVQGQDLDPMNGMYWTWQSGYINVKLEGFYSKELAEKEEFTYHLGGYSGNKNAIQKVELTINPKQKEIFIEMNLATFFNQINVLEQNMVMSPSVKAVEMSKTMAEIFSVERK